MLGQSIGSWWWDWSRWNRCGPFSLGRIMILGLLVDAWYWNSRSRDEMESCVVGGWRLPGCPGSSCNLRRCRIWLRFRFRLWIRLTLCLFDILASKIVSLKTACRFILPIPRLRGSACFVGGTTHAGNDVCGRGSAHKLASEHPGFWFSRKPRPLDAA
jgi:hypothetical protein